MISVRVAHGKVSSKPQPGRYWNLGEEDSALTTLDPSERVRGGAFTAIF